MALAIRLVSQYRVVLEAAAGGGYVGRTVEMPLVFADGRTPNSCAAATREAQKLAVAMMLDRGQAPPPPSTDRRNLQVNIRMSPQEKGLLEQAAVRGGFRSISDFTRVAAVEAAQRINIESFRSK